MSNIKKYNDFLKDLKKDDGEEKKKIEGDVGMKPYLEIRNLRDLCKSLGLPESHAPRVEMRRDLVVAIKDAISKKALTHAIAAEKCGVGRTVITAIANGNIAKISTDKLIDVASNLGIKMHLEIAA